MFNSLNSKIADAFVDTLPGTGAEGRARKATLQYRREQSPEREAAALALLNGLGENVQAELRMAARL